MSKGFLSWIRSNDKVIINLLEQQSELVVGAASKLLELAKATEYVDTVKQYQSQIRNLERDGIQITRKLFNIIDETFVTPLDREDISRLSTFIEKILNHIKKVADRFVLFGIGKPSSEMVELIEVLNVTSKEVSSSISQIKNLKNAVVIMEHSNNVSKFFEQADLIYGKAISDLFKSNNPIEILKSKEIYDYLQRAINRCLDLTELLEDMALKYA